MFPETEPVLVVDDMELIRQVVKTELKNMGFKILAEAADGQEALDIIKAGVSGKKIQLIIADWNMPNMDGLQLLKEVRGNPDTENLPYILLTTESEMENVMEAIRAGVSNYIVKPFEAGTLAEKIRGVYKKHFG